MALLCGVIFALIKPQTDERGVTDEEWAEAMGGDADFVLRLTDGVRTAYALWTVGEEHRLRLPLPAGNGTLVEMLGQRRELRWEGEGPAIRVSGSPQYLLTGGS